jgi:asparagine synthase (glutamine-hydrolysing)
LYFFSFGYIPDPFTAFRHIRKLPPGHLLEFANGELQVRQYWNLPEYGTQGLMSEEECLAEIESRLSEAVRIRLISDVPLGALLSGGVDSSTVVALMARHTSGPVKTFSIGFGKHDFNEAAYARIVARRFGTDHHELILKPDFAATLDKLTRILEEPFADSSILPTYCVCWLARQHVTVALSGDGGDELFSGYDRYIVNLHRRKFDLIPAWAGRLYRQHVYPALPSGVRGRKLAYNISLPSPERYLDGISFLPVSDGKGTFFSEDFRTWALGQPAPFDLFRNYLNRAPTQNFLERLMYLDTKTYLTADILTKVDRMSMATSLEVRVPILDHVFLEWVTSLPTRWKLRGNTRKYILKKLAERVGVPPEVLHRRKQGFSMPLVHWMRHELKSELVQLLLEPRTIERGYFDRRPIEQTLQEHLTGRRDRSGEIWLLLMFELWHRNFLESPEPFVSQPIPPPLRLKTSTRTGRLAETAALKTPVQEKTR